MICNVARPAMTSKILISLKAVKFLIKPDILSYQIRDNSTGLFHTFSAESDEVHQIMGIDASPKINGTEEGLQGAS
jgi:hypothetical protein